MSEKEEALSWEINAGELKIRESNVVLLPLAKLSPHPDNRPLGPSEEKIRQLKNLIAQNGFDSSHPLVVRPYSLGYQIIEGEHRYKAAKSLGYLQLPCVVRELDDTEALIQLVLGNIQSESRPLEIGLNALKVVQKDGKYSVSDYARRLGASETTVRRYMNASEAFQFLQAQLPEGAPILDEVYKLEEIHRCPQTDWLWLHDLIIKKELSKNQVIEISQAIREIKTDNPLIYALFDFMKLRQEIAQSLLNGHRQMGDTYKELIHSIESSYAQLEDKIMAYEYNVMLDAVESEEIGLKEWFINQLKALKVLTKQNVLEVYKDALQLKRNSQKEEAERTAAYFRDKKNAKEREEQERLEREMRQVKPGEWWRLGNHWLYCGDGSDPAFFQKLPDHVALAYLNPPHWIWPKSAPWPLDIFGQKAETIAATPPLESLATFFQHTRLPYQWSLATPLNLKKNEAGTGGWIFTAIFSRKKINPQVRDTWKIDASDLQGNKTREYLQHLLEAFSRERDVVVDAYAGLGMMFLLAEESTRFCYGAEKDPLLCKTILEKWEEASGEKARRL
ncbi:MAG: hypothetical protein OHK0053_09420 [Microscillaceae bacterium]